MKKLSFISFVLFVIFASNQIAPAQKTDSRIVAIRGQVAAVDKNLGKYTKQTKTVEGVALEGAEAVFYTSAKVLRKIHADIAGETYGASADFYYKDAQLIFAFYRLDRYDTQIGLNKPVKVVRTEEKRLYFAGGKIIKMLDGKTNVTPNSKSFDESRDEIIEISNKLREAF